MIYNLPIERQYLLGPSILLAVLAVIFFTPLNGIFEFDRAAIESGQYWQLFTSQFTHSNLAHLLLNALGVVFIWSLHGEYTNAQRYLFNIILLSIVTGTAIYLLSPSIHYYTGLSGVLHGVIIWGTLKDIKLGRKDGWLLLIGVIGKLSWEQIHGASDSIASLIESSVATDAHLFGAVAGCILFMLFDLRKKPT
ncbi:rhombosortase [Pseudoalteromonas xiamenensis]|uniref:rhombosortase n=1 Tax=Pseudoalteromonas xiamenensis TaxID=882626 RepID=UPI0035E7A2FA